eukprot:PITA_31288
MKEGTSIADHLNAFNTLLVQLESIEVKFQSEDKAITLLCSLPESWDHFVTSISLSSSETIEFDDVVASLLSEETRRRSHLETSTSKAMMDCWKRQQQTSKEDSSTKKKEENTTDTGSTSSSGMSDEVLSVNLSNHDQHWLLYSGASNHMCIHKEWFKTYKSINDGVVYMGNDVTCNIVGIGSIQLQMFDGTTNMLIDVRHVPDLRRNLISLGALDTNGYKTVIEGGVMKIYGGILLVMKANKESVGLHVEKSDVLTVFKQFRALVENNTGRTIKCLRTDNGGEFISKEFDNYCKDAGIERHNTTVYTPQQNGVVEHMNMTLLERARSMLSNAGLQTELWTEAVATTCYVINRSPSTAIGCKIPQEHIQFDNTSNDSHDDHSSDTSCEQVSDSDHEQGSGIDHEQVSDTDHQEVPTDGSQPIEEAPETSLRRSTRMKRPPKRYDDYVTSVAFTANDDEPLCYQEAVEGSKSDKWKAAMKDEMMALRKNGTWDMVELPKNRKTVGCKWVFKQKRGVNDTEDRYKVRLVAKGFSEKASIDFHEIFSPVVKIVSIRVVLALVALLDLELQQLNVKTAFLHGDLDEEIYMEQPEGFVQHRNKKFVCRLKKSLYGLKQSPRQWYKKLDSFMLS